MEFNTVDDPSSPEEPRGCEGYSLQAEAQAYHADYNRVGQTAEACDHP